MHLDRDMVYQENHFKNIILGGQKFQMRTALRSQPEKG